MLLDARTTVPNDPDYIHLDPPIEDDSETLSLSHALRLSKYQGPIRLSRVEVLEPEIAHALVEHRGRELSLPAVRLLSPEVAGLLTGYDGQLTLDGLWLLDSIPLAGKLASQWKAQGVAAVYPNFSVDVAEALDLWPPPSPRWPPGKTFEDGAKLPMLWVLDDEERSKLSHAEQRALEKWQEYSTRRAELANAVLRDIKNRTGVGLFIDEVMGEPSLLAPIVEAEKRFCTAWVINETVPPDDPHSTGWFYINKEAECVGPITWQELEAAKDRPHPYFYWQNLDSPGPRISDITIGPRDCDDSDSRDEKAALACLLAGELYTKVIRESLRWTGEYAAEFGMPEEETIDLMCRHFLKLEDIVKWGLDLVPALKSIPHVGRLRGRLRGVATLKSILSNKEYDLDANERRHIRKWIRRFEKE